MSFLSLWSTRDCACKWDSLHPHDIVQYAVRLGRIRSRFWKYLLNLKNMSITTIAILQHCSALLRQTFRTFFDRLESLDLMTTNMQATLYPYSGYKVDTSNLPYPGLKPSEDSPGMSFELRNVSFSYPGSSTKALDNISLSIKPDQLVVIVGANGSGKSTIVKLLARLYDSSDGQVLVDGDLRQATANLTQDHQLYPLTLGENIGLGDPEHSEDRCRIVQAAKQGGAPGILERQMNGLDTILHQPSVQEMKQRSELSGGERQRVVAARTFMRLQSGKIKCRAMKSFNSPGTRYVNESMASSAHGPWFKRQLSRMD
ncbi:P-loop containing nucleoside triphosphate hydrolase protein [Mycena floridula]|nr:P-loop containing nucleoside triphosphate hydrolase protein [Mycena floridula]